MDYLKLTVDKLSVDALTELVTDDSCGAISIFVGTTRSSFEGKKVVRLEYEAYEPMAIKAMKAICEEVREKWPMVHNIAIYHRLGSVPCRESSVVIAVSSPHRRESLEAVSHCIERLKATVPIWKKEIYEGEPALWKENVECSQIDQSSSVEHVYKHLIQINVSSEELQKRIQNFIVRKREQVNISNIHDFIPGGSEMEDVADTCARVRAQFIKRNDSKGHLKIRKVHNEWGPQTVTTAPPPDTTVDSPGLPPAIAERVLSLERYLNTGPVSKDIYKRLKDMEDKIAQLESISPEYAQFWKSKKESVDRTQQNLTGYAFSADDIARKIEQLEKADL